MENASVFFITIPYSVILRQEVKIDKLNAGINILIDQSDIDYAALFLFISECNYNYILSISENVLLDTSLEPMLPGLYTLFSLSSSYFINIKRIPVLFSGDLSYSASAINLLEYFRRQGENEVELVFFSSEENSIKQGIVLLNPFLPGVGEDCLIESYIADGKAAIIISSPVEKKLTGESMAKLLSLPGSFAIPGPSMLAMALQCENNWLRKQSLLWDNRSRLYISFIALSKRVAQGEYYDLKNWYEKEYEMLPLWFKRLGHIVHVITGKRRWKSLFNDSVKRYYE